MKTIYNTYVTMESQEQCDRMKQLCIDNGLPIWDCSIGFVFIKDISYFSYSKVLNFAIYGTYFEEEIEITEQEFIELLKNTKL